MIFNLGGKQSIKFKTDVKGLEDIAPVRPAKYFLPKWFKDVTKNLEEKEKKEFLENFYKKPNIHLVIKEDHSLLEF